MYSLRREERSVSTKFCGTALKRHRDARVNQKQSFEFAGRDAALDRQSSNINDLSSSIPDNDTPPDFSCAAFHDQFQLSTGRLRNGAVLRGDNPDGFRLCVQFQSCLVRVGFHPSDRGSRRVGVEIARHPTRAKEGVTTPNRFDSNSCLSRC